MLNIYIKPVEQCNLRCKHCYNGCHREKLDFAKLRSYLAKLDKFDKYIIWHGGEPLLGDIEEMSRTMDQLEGCEWRVTTNLTLPITGEAFSFLRRATEVRTSFDIGIRFGNIRNLNRWRRNVRLLTEAGFVVMVNICATTALLKKDPAKLLRMLSRLGVKKFYVDALTDTGNAHMNPDIFPSYEDLDDWLVRLHEANKKYKLQNMREYEIIAGLRKEFQFCRGAECCHSTLTINSDGTVAGCVEDSRAKAFSSLKGDAVNDVRHIATRKCRSVHHAKCLSCSYYPYCHGGCKNIPWQGETCPYPKKLSDILKEELS